MRLNQSNPNYGSNLIFTTQIKWLVKHIRTKGSVRINTQKHSLPITTIKGDKDNNCYGFNIRSRKKVRLVVITINPIAWIKCPPIRNSFVSNDPIRIHSYRKIKSKFVRILNPFHFTFHRQASRATTPASRNSNYPTCVLEPPDRQHCYKYLQEEKNVVSTQSAIVSGPPLLHT